MGQSYDLSGFLQSFPEITITINSFFVFVVVSAVTDGAFTKTLHLATCYRLCLPIQLPGID